MRKAKAVSKQRSELTAEQKLIAACMEYGAFMAAMKGAFCSDPHPSAKNAEKIADSYCRRAEAAMRAARDIPNSVAACSGDRPLPIR